MTANIHAPWREKAACRVNPAMFDDMVEGETTSERRMRVELAYGVCLRCPVAAACAADVDIETDSGIRAGMVIERRREGATKVPIKEWLATMRPAQSSIRKKGASRHFAREHGTMRGYRQHSERKDMPPCASCKAAKAAANAVTNARRNRRKAA